MQESTSAQSLIVQLSSLTTHLEKVAGGYAALRDLELMAAVNGVLKDCIILQKNMKFKKVKQSMLEGAESYISESDFQKLKNFLESLQPSISVSQSRVSRLIGQMSPDGKISAESVKENILDVFETQKNKLEAGAPGSEPLELQDLTLQSAEAICEVIRRLIAQENSKLQR